MEWLLMGDFDEFEDDLISLQIDQEDEGNKIGWFTARTYVSNEDRLIEQLWDKVRQYRLGEEVLEILSIKETVIDESKEYLPDSLELPKTEFRNSKTSIWVKTNGGYFKKIRLKVVRPFKSFIFIKMLGDTELFEQIQRWSLGLSFLGYPNPNLVSEDEVLRMKKMFSEKAPSLEDYIAEKEYQIVSGPVSNFVKSSISSAKSPEEEGLGYDPEEGREEIKTVEEIEDKYDSSIIQDRRDIVIEKLRVNDFVFLVEMGARGVVKEVDLKNKIVTVDINLFGRNQTLRCSPQQLKEF
ncbi:transcription termination/antitermination protein NusG [Mycoplasma ovis]|uniref:transcription termination/antitermination protein NusG n=1 Tax=Mycoplasma ovis TaxID=171632 RepID=UPI0005C782B9|nr:transcription termination/antitermination protein NusG [Mycoplasma ovis]